MINKGCDKFEEHRDCLLTKFYTVVAWNIQSAIYPMAAFSSVVSSTHKVVDLMKVIRVAGTYSPYINGGGG